jgi:hypothetical protein
VYAYVQQSLTSLLFDQLVVAVVVWMMIILLLANSRCMLSNESDPIDRAVLP